MTPRGRAKCQGIGACGVDFQGEIQIIERGLIVSNLRIYPAAINEEVDIVGLDFKPGRRRRNGAVILLPQQPGICRLCEDGYQQGGACISHILRQLLQRQGGVIIFLHGDKGERNAMPGGKPAARIPPGEGRFKRLFRLASGQDQAGFVFIFL